MTMKLIGILGGTSWPSTIDYYKICNELVSSRLGGYYSARILLYSVNYNPLKSNYGPNWQNVPPILSEQLQNLVDLKPDCVLVANNTLHKAIDDPVFHLDYKGLPLFHIVNETGKAAQKEGYQKLLLLGTKFTMEDGYYESKLEDNFGLDVEIPSLEDRNRIQESQTDIALGGDAAKHFDVFRDILSKYTGYDAVVPACTELPLVVLPETTSMPILNPTFLQCKAAVDFALEGVSA